MTPPSFVIACNLEVKPETGTTAAWYRLSTNGRTVFEDYEHHLTSDQRQMVGSILQTHGEVQASVGQRLLHKPVRKESKC